MKVINIKTPLEPLEIWLDHDESILLPIFCVIKIKCFNFGVIFFFTNSLKTNLSIDNLQYLNPYSLI